MKSTYPEFNNTILHFCGNINLDDFAEFHVKRLAYESTEKLIEIYNHEVEIGMTGEKIQILYFIILHKMFIRDLGKSPIILDVDKATVKIKGKIYSTKNGFEFKNQIKSHLRII